MTMETYCIYLAATHDGEKAAVLTKKGGGSTNSARHAKRAHSSRSWSDSSSKMP